MSNQVFAPSMEDLSTALRRKYAEYAQNATLPDRTEERFRKFDFSGFQLSALAEKPALEADLVWAEKAQIDSIPLDMEEWLDSFSDIYDPFVIYNLSNHNSLMLLNVSGDNRGELRYRGSKVAQPLKVVYIASGCRVTLTEYVEADCDLWNSLTFIYAGEGSRVNYQLIRRTGLGSVGFFNVFVDQRASSELTLSTVRTGSGKAKCSVYSRLDGMHASFRGLGLSALSGFDFDDTQIDVEHAHSRTESAIEYRSMVAGRSHSIYTGNVRASKATKAIRSRQVNHNRILSEKARAESNPRLIIESEHVEASHGSTAGAIDESVMFFLQCRGLSEEEARELLLEGFASELLGQMDLVSEEAERLLEEVKSKMEP